MKNVYQLSGYSRPGSRFSNFFLLSENVIVALEKVQVNSSESNLNSVLSPMDLSEMLFDALKREETVTGDQKTLFVPFEAEKQNSKHSKLVNFSKWLQYYAMHITFGLFVLIGCLFYFEEELREIVGIPKVSPAYSNPGVAEILAEKVKLLIRVILLLIVSILPYCYAIFDKYVIPAIVMWAIVQFFSDKRPKQQELEIPKEARYPETVILGWNLFERIYDENGNLIGMDFTIPTEDVFPLNDIVSFDPVLSAKLSDKATAPYLARNSIDYPDFAIGMDTKDEQIQVNRGAGNKISSVFLKFASQAKSFKADPKLKENPIYILTCEKTSSTQKIPTEHSRIWLIYPSELRMLLQYEKEINDEKSTFFKFGRPSWRLRLQNLLLWAKAEFLAPSPKKYICGEVFLPPEPIEYLPKTKYKKEL